MQQGNRWIMLGRRIAKNLLGALLLLFGLLMLVTPGQGILMILVALMMLEYPHKCRFERWLVSRKRVGSGINWLRNKAGAPPLDLDWQTPNR